jgi:glycosyltransferase involved in cell wall biosynthesis
VEHLDGVPVHRMALRLPWELPVNPLAPPEVRRRLRSGGFDVAHVQMGVVSPFATDLADVALGVGVPTAITWHCLMGRSQPLFRLLGHARRWGARGAALSAVSAVAARTVQDVVGDAAAVAVLPNGIDVARWQPQDDPGQGGHDPVRVVAAMRLAARKRPAALVRVLARAAELLGDSARLELTLFGDGPERSRLERLVERLGLAGSVRLPGRVHRDVLRDTYWRSDVYLTTARLEAFGIAALEARTAGLPVVSRRDTGVGDFVVHEVNGLLVDDDAALAAALARLAADRDLLRRLGRHNRTTAPGQSWPAVAALAEAEYRRAGAA